MCLVANVPRQFGFSTGGTISHAMLNQSTRNAGIQVREGQRNNILAWCGAQSHHREGVGVELAPVAHKAS